MLPTASHTIVGVVSGASNRNLLRARSRGNLTDREGHDDGDVAAGPPQSDEEQDPVLVPNCTREELYIQDFQELKAVLAFLAQAFPEGFSLSTLKTKIHAVFGKRLSEAVFHQTTLLDLMLLPPLAEIIIIIRIVKLQGDCDYLVQPNWDTWKDWGNPNFRSFAG